MFCFRMNNKTYTVSAAIDSMVSHTNIMTPVDNLNQPIQKVMELVERYDLLTSAEQELVNQTRPGMNKLQELVQLPAYMTDKEKISNRPLGDWMNIGFYNSIHTITSRKPVHSSLQEYPDFSMSIPLSPTPDDTYDCHHVKVDPKTLKLEQTWITFYNKKTDDMVRLTFQGRRRFDEITMHGLEAYGKNSFGISDKAYVDVFMSEDRSTTLFPISMALFLSEKLVFQNFVYEGDDKDKTLYGILNLPVVYNPDE